MDGAAVGSLQRELRIEAEQREHRGGQVGRSDGMFVRALAGLVAGADDLAPLQAAPRHQHAEDARPMVATGRGVELGSAAEFSHDDDERGIEQAALA